MPVLLFVNVSFGNVENVVRHFSYLISFCRVGKRVVNVPSFNVRVDSQKHIDSIAGRPGRGKKKAAKAAASAAAGGGDAADDDE